MTLINLICLNYNKKCYRNAYSKLHNIKIISKRKSKTLMDVKQNTHKTKTNTPNTAVLVSY